MRIEIMISIHTYVLEEKILGPTNRKHNLQRIDYLKL